MRVGMAAEVATAAAMEEEEEDKLGQVTCLRCLEAVREGLKTEKRVAQREQRSLTALGTPGEFEEWTRMGSR